MSTLAPQQAYEKAEEAFIARNPKSKELYERATECLPGGNTRSVLFYKPFPFAVAKAEGAKLYDVDGHVYTDFLGEYTAGLYGHSNPVIVDAIQQAAARGLSYGAHHEDEVKLATLVRERFPSMQLLRFTNSGTESTLMALATAKVYTGKKKIIVFEGGYHGGAFSFKSGNSPLNAPHEYLKARYNDLESVEALVSHPANANDIAAIITEPMLGSGGAIPGTRGFLEGLRRIADKCGAVYIFDEVMTSRMYNGGGVQSQLSPEVRPDMTTLGKYIGGGSSFGAFGGKREIMQMYDPRTPNALAHAGTFNNNQISMRAGCAGLESVFTPQRAGELHEQGEQLRKRLQAAAEGSLLEVTGLGSLMCFHFTTTPESQISCPGDVKPADAALGGLLHLYLIERGYYIARRGFLSLNLALSETDVDGFVNAVQGFLREHQSAVMLN